MLKRIDHADGTVEHISPLAARYMNTRPYEQIIRPENHGNSNELKIRREKVLDDLAAIAARSAAKQAASEPADFQGAPI